MRSSHQPVVSHRRLPFALVAGIAAVAIGVAWWPGLSGGQAAHHPVLDGVHIAWPAEGESAIAVNGDPQRFSRPAGKPLPIASVAKVMTAYVVLRHHPLGAGAAGFSMTLTDADAQLSITDSAEGQSFVPVQSGEVLTERDALEALLLPSANNIAMALATYTSGTVAAFVAEMNHQAALLHMTHTTYTDPSGYADTTVSTARDQLRLARLVMKNPAFAQIVAMPTAVLPVVGMVRNTNALLGRDGFVGGKTGSDSAAGGCLMFDAVRLIHGHRYRFIGVVLGQRDGALIAAGLDAADDLVNSITARLAAQRPHTKASGAER
jgi:D-alanyl-D-alanine carboxypeptidase (penicillin-binding protein 5/6)